VGNLVTDGSGTGILLNDNTTGCTLDGNTVLNNTTTGLKLNNPGVTRNLVIRNTASRNGADYQMGTGNSFGPIANVNGVGDISLTAGATHPWTNFSY
jgi:parallel beta-helix repeat protein